MAQVGRISGPLLTANLERQGKDIWFRNTSDDTKLLYLTVNDGIIGVNNDYPTYTLDVLSTIKTTNLISTTSADIADFDISNSTINNKNGDIFLNAQEAIVLSNFETDNIHASDNTITAFQTNSDLDLSPHGTGTIEILTSLNVDGNLHATGNITFDGTFTLGDADNDSVIFNADIQSDLVPTEIDSGRYDLGSSAHRWENLYTNQVHTDSITTNKLKVSNIETELRAGNIIYVSQNGDDTNVGDHPQGPFKTLKRALEFADASTQGPVQIFIYAGGYEEETPLTVPSNVSIIGEDMRNTIIRPESAYQSEDVFLLNGESTVQNLTIKDFYYDSGNDTGYAFRFAPNTIVTTRSPYIQNITVITQGTTTSASDPRGFASGDAGKGALIDGADVLSASEEASMLFHSVTFITPGVDAVTMTNGVRVEWLNSFTYFANRGLYAIDGATGHLSTDGSTVKYGAELRSIGSANVYGNYGAVADGTDCLMYLIQHNMAYIGVGKYIDNDPSRVLADQEVTELNSGKIYYQTIDHLGNFKVGDDFEINQETGETTLVLTEADIDSLNGITVTTGGDTTEITGSKIETGNLRFSGNLAESTLGDINIAAYTGEIQLLKNTNVTGNVSTTGNFTIGGNITFGNQTTDTIAFPSGFNQDVDPDISGLYDLGKTNKRWFDVHLSQANISDIRIQDNFITTTESNADLELRANGTGKIYLPTNNLNVTNNFTVSGNTDLDETTITGTVTHTGDRDLTKHEFTVSLVRTIDNPSPVLGDVFGYSIDVQGDTLVVGAYGVDTTGTNDGEAYVFDIPTGNLVATLQNPDIENVTGSDFFGYSVAINETQIVVGSPYEDFYQPGGYTDPTITRTSTGTVYRFNRSNYSSYQTLQSTVGSSRFGTRVAAGGEDGWIATKPGQDRFYYRYETTGGGGYLGGDLSIDNPSDVAMTEKYIAISSDTTGSIADNVYVYEYSNVTNPSLYRTFTNPYAYDVAWGRGQNSVAIHGNYVAIGAQNANSEFAVANGAVHVYDITTGDPVYTFKPANDDPDIDQDYFKFGSVVDISDKYVVVGQYSNISINKVYVYDLETGRLATIITNPEGYGTYFGGSLKIEGNKIIIGAMNAPVSAGFVGVAAGAVYVYEITQSILPELNTNFNTTNLTLTQDLTANSQAYFEDVMFEDNVIKTSRTNSDLELRASGTGNIIVPDTDVIITNNLTVRDITTDTINVVDNITSVELIASDNLTARDNYITTTESNSDLELRPSGTGLVRTPNKVTIENNITVEGDMTFNGDLSGDDVLSVSDITAANLFNAERLHTDDQINIWDNNIATVVSNSDLELRATNGEEVYDTSPSTATYYRETYNRNLSVISGGTIYLAIDTWSYEVYAKGATVVNTTIYKSTSKTSSTAGPPPAVDPWPTNSITNFSYQGNTYSLGTEQTSSASEKTFALEKVGGPDVLLETLKVNTYNLYTETTSIELIPNKNITVDSDKALRLPRGADTYTFSGSTGEIRFNTDDNVFEGVSNARVGFGGVYSDDRLTSITADTTADNIKIVVNGEEDPVDSAKLVGEVNGDGLIIHGLQVDDVLFDNNLISTTVSNSDLELRRNGTGEIIVGETQFVDNKIKNISTTSLTIANTGFGYIKLNTTGGFVVPVGDNTAGERGPAPRQGETRWNETDGFLEVYTGTEWINSIGPIDSVSAAEMGDISDEWSLILG